MKVVRFEPGDATSYLVMFHVLTQEEADAIGGLGAGAVLFGFGTRAATPLAVHAFQPEGFLELGYYQSKMQAPSLYTAAAGLLVLCELTGREAGIRDSDLHVSDRWHPHWRDQLAALRPGVPA